MPDEPSVEELNDLTPVKPGVKKEPQFAIDISGSESYPAAEGSDITRWEVVQEGFGALVAALEGLDSQAAAEAAAGEDAGGVMSVAFSNRVIDLEDINSKNWREKLDSLQIGGGTYVRPAIDKLTELYMEEFGDTPDMDKPLQLLTVITDGEAHDIAEFIEYLKHLSSRTFVVVAIVGYGAEHEQALAQYKKVESEHPDHLRVLTFDGTTNPQVLADGLIALIGE